MCGITGIFSFSNNSNAISDFFIKKMTDVIEHRGPDDDGFYIDDSRRIALGFRRLSIIDLSEAGHQPMSNNDGTIWITFNGEIYNHEEIRSDLISEGYTYKSKTDTETILYAYQEYGVDFITKLYGMFGIAIWDTRKEELLLVRDRVGIKPIYYTFSNGVFLWGSEIKSIKQHPYFKAEFNEQGFYDYLSIFMTPPNETMFKGVFKLEAGHFMIIDKDGNSFKKQYWDVNNQTEIHTEADLQDEKYCVENIQRLLRDSIKLRMMSDVPFGVLLSGGVDSSLNVALMSELMSRPVETFTVGFKDLQKYNELQFADQISKQFKTNHHEVLLTEQDAIDWLPKMIWHQDEPNADPVCVPVHFVSKLARENNTLVVQVGEGADEEFAGYKLYTREQRFYKYYYSLLPYPLKKIAYKTFQKIIPDSHLTDYSRRAVESDAPFYGGATGFSEEHKKHLLGSEFKNRCEKTGRIPQHYNEKFEGLFGSGSFSEDYLRRIFYYELKARLGEMLLMRVDKMTMATSIEARVPFLDHRIVEFAMRVPSKLKIKNGINKYILKKASEGIIPNNIIYRPKQGFAAPAVEWLRTGKLATIAKETILESDLVKQNYLNKNYIIHLFDLHQSGKHNLSRELWILLIATMWYKENF